MVSATPWPLHLQESDPVIVVQGRGWASEFFLVAPKILPPAAFEPQTIQPVVSHYADRAIWPPVNMNGISKNRTDYYNKIYALCLPVPL